MSLTAEIINHPDPATLDAGIEGRIPDNFEQATGLERQEMIEIAQGNDVRKRFDQGGVRRMLRQWQSHPG